MISLLTDRKKWNIKKPELIISVTGGAKLNLNSELKETFCKGIVKAATTTSIEKNFVISLSEKIENLLQKMHKASETFFSISKSLFSRNHFVFI